LRQILSHDGSRIQGLRAKPSLIGLTNQRGSIEAQEWDNFSEKTNKSIFIEETGVASLCCLDNKKMRVLNSYY
jgi:hypothetical protein